MNRPKRDISNLQRDKVRAVLETEFSHSIMNDTKWMEVFDVLSEFRVRTRLKRIFDPEPCQWMPGTPGGGSASWLPKPWVDESLPFRVVEIEWLEIEAVTGTENDGAKIQGDLVEVLEARLHALSVPFTWQDGTIRIVGHQRKP